ncbi:MAG: hypothetical protein ABJO30_10630 [Hyphomicrobiales bacterium]
MNRFTRPCGSSRPRAFLFGLLLTLISLQPASADSSSPLLAAFYDRQMAIIDGVAYAWQGNDTPKRVTDEAIQVGVGRSAFYVLNRSHELHRYNDDFQQPELLMSSVVKFAAGRTGVLATKADGSLWLIASSSTKSTKIADNVDTAAVGDGANYYITKSGGLFVKGKAHRGQYGDGRLKSTDEFVETASQVSQITAHTGHAILLNDNGEVLGTGGNIFGPVGKHGLGDKAIKWSKIMGGAKGIATGSSHSVAISQDNTLFAWGSEYGVEPVAVMKDVQAVAAGSSTTIALTQDGRLWQWARGEDAEIVLLD